MRKIRILPPLLLLLALSAGSPLHAQTLQACLDYAQEHSLRLVRADLGTQKAKSLEGSAFDPGRTGLSLSQDPTSGGSPDNALTLSQELDFPTVYVSRRKQLEADTRVQESRLLLTGSELRRDVSSAYCTLLLKKHIVELLSHQEAALEEFVRLSEARFGQGETNRLEVINATRMRAGNAVRLQEARNEEREAATLLQQLMNTSVDIVPTDAYLCVREDPEEYAFEQTPAGILSESEIALSERTLALTRQEGYLPSFSLGVRHQLVLPGVNPYQVDRTPFDKGNWMGFEVGMAIPLFYGSQKRKAAAARYDADMARVSQQEARIAYETRLSVARDKLGTARRTYNYFVAEALPQAEEIRTLSGIEYGAGSISYVEYIQNLTTALETEIDAARAADTLNQAIIEINFIKGN